MRAPSIALIATGLLLVGCAEGPTVPSDAGHPESVDTPNLAFENAPAESGIVMRAGVPFAVTWVDGATGFRVVLGADLDEFCNGIINFDIWSLQDVFLDGRTVGIAKDETQTSVWDFPSFDCSLYLTRDPVASGYANVIYNDNFAQGTGPDDATANAWGYSAHGTLTDGDGEDVHFSGHLRQKFNNSVGYSVNTKISLR